MATSLNDVPIFTIKNDNNTQHPVGPNCYNKWRKMCKKLDEITLGDSNTQLPWMSLYKTHKDLLKIDLVTTVGYDINNNIIGPVKFMRGFPLMLQGSDSQFTDAGNISSDHWEYDWPFYKNHVEDFSGNLTEDNVNWLNNNSGNSQVITDFNNENRRNLLILDLSNFYLHNNTDQKHLISEAGNNNINNKTRPQYLVIRLDTAIEESSFHKDCIHGKARDDLMIFNYVYSGYVISPYDFMANFTTDYLRSVQVNNNSSSNYYINKNNHFESIVPEINVKDTIQLMNNKGKWEDAFVSNAGETLTISSSHDNIISPFRYNFHLFPSQLEVFDFLDINGQSILPADVSNNPIGPAADVYDITTTIFNKSRFNTIESTLSTLSNILGPHPPNSNDNWTYHIENLIWCSLSSSRHTLYAKKDIEKELYIGNYLNINEVEYDENGDYLEINEITTDASGNIISAHENSNYMPTFKKASGTIYRGTSEESILGLNEVNMPRKTLTPYYKVGERYNEYAFNWNDTSKGWSHQDGGVNGINNSTNKIDVSNCTVVEYRNLVEFKADMSIQYTFDKDKRTTFVTSINPAMDEWKGNVKLDNNSIKACDANGVLLSEENQRLLTNGLSDEYFKVEWSGTDLSANTSKYGYLIDVASGSHEVTTDKINSNTKEGDNFLKGTLIKDNLKIISRVFQIRLDKLTDDNEIVYSENKTINYNIDSNDTKIAIYSYPNNNNNRFHLFGYLNFIGIRSTELLGNTKNYLTIKNVFRQLLPNDQKRIETRIPYFIIDDTRGFKPTYKSSSKMVYNSNIFYARTNFSASNVLLSIDDTNPGFDGEILFLNKTIPISWRDGYTNGIEITNISSAVSKLSTSNNDVGIKLGLFSTDIRLFITSVIGKSSRNERTLDSTQNIINKSIELNNNLVMDYYDSDNVNQKNIKFNFLQYDNINFCSSQGDLFLSDFWKWSNSLVSSVEPPPTFDGDDPTNTIANRNLNNRYNFYNWNDTDAIPVPIYYEDGTTRIYNNNGVHNPQFALENQSLINFIVELSSISVNYSHILVNTWSGSRIGNKFQSIGLKSFRDSDGNFITESNPIIKIKILGGGQITPNIEDTPAIFNISANAKFNFATSQNTNDAEGNSKAPSNIKEAEEDETPINFTNAPFTTEASPGWFAETGFNPSRTGIFRDTTGAINKYSTIDFSSNIISQSPTNLLLTDSHGDPISGRFSNEEQEFPLELLFCYPYDISQLDIAKPQGYITSYQNSDNTPSTTSSFDDFKGHKRFSNIYAISLTGSASGNENFKNRIVFPENIIINCVELPPPKQINNSNDMLSFDNNSVKIVWKGYNFSEPTKDFRSIYGDTGDIIWKIERLQTQLGFTKIVHEGPLIPDGGNYSLSKYIFIDNSIRIYDKYIYTVTGTYEYKFKRVFVNTNSNTLSLNFGSFNTDEILICKNNKFEYGRYNTTSTNLKLFRPLLIKRDGGQVDEEGNQTVGGRCIGNIFSGTTRISSSQNIYANTSNTLTKKQTYVLLSKNQIRPFR